MTLSTFLRRLRQTPRTWTLTWVGNIRNGRHCPLSYVARSKPCAVQPSRLNMDLNLALDIADAADGTEGSVRAQLLRACGLTERDEKKR